KRLQAAISAYQARNESIPTRETELTELQRDYATLNKSYTDLLAKKFDSRMAANLESGQVGEQFQILDPARLPERPDSPNRPRFVMMGAAGGVAIGLLLIALFEYRDKSFKTDAEVKRVLSLPVLAVVPLMQSTREKQKALRWRLVTGIGLTATLFV